MNESITTFQLISEHSTGDKHYSGYSNSLLLLGKQGDKYEVRLDNGEDMPVIFTSDDYHTAYIYATNDK